MKNRLRVALELHQAGDLAAAERAYRQLLHDPQSDANALHLLGLNLHEQGRSREGLEFVKQAIDRMPSVGVLYNSLGVLQMAMDDLRSAEASFRQALSLDPGCEEAKRNLIVISQKSHPAGHELGADGTNSSPPSTRHGDEISEEKLRQHLSEFPDDIEVRIQLARLFASRGEQHAIVELLAETVKRFPQNQEMGSLLGEALGNLGRHEDAEAVFALLLKEFPNDVNVQTNFGVSQLAQERVPNAIASFEAACRLSPHHYRAHFLLGVAQRKARRLEQAEASLRRALSLNSNSREARLELACLYRESGSYPKGIELLQEILKTNPCHAPALLELATCCEMLDNVDQVVQGCVEALRVDSKFAPAHLLLGMILSSRLAPEVRAKIDLDEREDLAEKALLHLSSAATFAPSAEAFDAWGVALINLGRHAEAREKVQEALERQPEFAHAHESLGRILLEQGHMVDACANFAKAIELDPRRTLSQYELARSGKISDKRHAIGQIQEVVQRSDLALQDRVFLHFALGVLFDAVKDYDTAFQHYQTANRLKIEDPRRKHRTGNNEEKRNAEQARTEALCETFSASFFRERKDLMGSGSDLPVFIVGMPRSGTTLVEQIVSSHPDVHGAGELMDITDLTLTLPRRLNTEIRYPQSVRKLDKPLLQDLADSYLKQLRSRNSNALRITDKMPTNFRHLGFIAMLFPNARVINVRRDPKDICISCFRQNLEWPYCDLEACAGYYLQYLRLMSHWKTVTPLEILDVRYEELVANPDHESRRLVEFCGLPWDDACLDFQTSNRAVQTPSKWQVRQPVYHSSVGAWKRYEMHLEPLNAILLSGG